MVGPVLDFLTQDPGADPARTALLGVSLGGHLAPRAAAYEPRLAAVVALDAVFDAVSALTAHLPLPHEEAVRRAAAEHDEDMDRLIADARAQSPMASTPPPRNPIRASCTGTSPRRRRFSASPRRKAATLTVTRAPSAWR
ncbi:alpha/beta hydrolase family protein [Streptomyces olivochromogenes]|uniref:Dipeptidyl aminopeptidase n=1 Tax=Streptomyces olivochromogenes TaxID=1963 RepID=A0A250VL03_STROL|nr:alpha/beta hydrolase [Streptomyces olivochromogenes]KUN44124.1 hypothetical protein AQJ27_28955 [Streptomyces olivochromogenes]GAX54887.1 dipeptidyl aminopeptidase [Streptomyces olivochromogenes]